MGEGRGCVRGVLHEDGGRERFELRRYPPAPAFAAFVDGYWSVAWDRRGRPRHGQALLPHPCIQLVVEAGRSGVFGIARERTVKVLADRGRAFGVKFRPAGFRAVWSEPLTALAGRRVPLDEAFGARGADYERALLAVADGPSADEERVARAEAFLADLDPALPEDAALARDVVEHVAADREAVRVEDVAAAFDLSVRGLQRLCERCVGATPKWIVQRYRIHEAVAALEAGRRVDLAALAARLGYFDQSHFTRDFSRLVGRPPARYLEDLRRPAR